MSFVDSISFVSNRIGGNDNFVKNKAIVTIILGHILFLTSTATEMTFAFQTISGYAAFFETCCFGVFFQNVRMIEGVQSHSHVTGNEALDLSNILMTP